MSQCEAILAYLETGNTLTPLQAFTLFNCLSLHSRAAELRQRGHLVTCELVEVESGKHVGLYRLERVAYG